MEQILAAYIGTVKRAHELYEHARSNLLQAVELYLKDEEGEGN